VKTWSGAEQPASMNHLFLLFSRVNLDFYDVYDSYRDELVLDIDV
jgi:hypothetical protein